jgi:hypothetical protein
VAAAILGAVVGVLGTRAHVLFWDSHPNVDVFRDRLRSIGDSQLLHAGLSARPWDTRLARAVEREVANDPLAAAELWGSEWRRRPWDRFAGGMFAELLLRTNRPADASSVAKALAEADPDARYPALLAQHLPELLDLLDDARWVAPRGARASLHGDWLERIADHNIGSWWHTGRAQARGDWIELDLDSRLPVEGMALVSAAALGQEPLAIEVTGRSPTGEAVPCYQTRTGERPWAGSVVVRFAPRSLRSLRVELVADAPRLWSIAEARVLYGAGSY